MSSLIFNNFRAFTFAVLIHIGFVAVMIFSFDWQSEPEPKVDIVKATVVDEKKVLAEIDKLKKAEQRKLKKEKDRKRKAEKDLKKIKKQRKQEEIKRKKEQARLAKLKKQKAKAKKEAEVLAEKRKEEDKKIKQQQAVETKRLKELEKKRKKEEQKLAEAAMQRELDEELKKEKAADKKKKQQDSAREKQAMTEIQLYKSKITADVEAAWRWQVNFKPGSKCTVTVKLIPGGEVADVKTSKCVGGALFETSVIAAVRRASPLPVSPDPYIFDKMRDIEFLFIPNKK